MQKYQSTIAATNGSVIRNVPVTVIKEDGSLAEIFMDREGQVPAPNPLVTDSRGVFYFYAKNGRYSLRTAADGVQITDADTVLLFDPDETASDGPIADAVRRAEDAAERAETALGDSSLQNMVQDAQDAAANAAQAVIDAHQAVASIDAALIEVSEAKEDAQAAAQTASTAASDAQAVKDSLLNYDGTLSATPEWSAVPAHEDSNLDAQTRAALNRIEKLKDDQQLKAGEVIEAEPSWDDVPKHKSDVFNAQAQALANRVEWVATKSADFEHFGGSSAPDFTGNADALNAALIELSSYGGGVIQLRAPYYRFDSMVTLQPNVTIAISDHTVIDCTRSTSAFSFYATGSLGDEVAIAANVTRGDNVIKTVAPHNLNVGDWVLLKSQRACLHADAGKDWRLGETTSGAAQPFFAEPVCVASVTSPTEFVTASSIIFPDYRTDKTQETYALARDSSTIQKINFLQGIKITGGVFKKSDEYKSLIRLILCDSPVVNASVYDLGYTTGVAVNLEKCLTGSVTGKATRPVDWSLNGYNHSAYNSFKDVGSWYCNWDVEDINGSQGFDQTYFDVPSLYPYVKMKSVNSHEDGLTTHGGCYGAKIIVDAIGAKLCAVRNRTRFSDIDVRAINCAKSDVGAVQLSTWGAADVRIKPYIQGGGYGIDINPVGNTATVDPGVNLQIESPVINGTRGPMMFFRDFGSVNTVPSGVRITGLSAKNFERGMVVQQGWNAITFDGLEFEGFISDTNTRCIELSPSTAGHTLRNVKANIGAGKCVVRLPSLGNAALRSAFKEIAFVDTDSMFVYGGGVAIENQGTTGGYISSSGRWVPTISAIQNCAGGSVTGQFTYSISGDVVSFAGTMVVESSASGLCIAGFTPVPGTVRNFSATTEASGVASAVSASGVDFGSIHANGTEEVLALYWRADSARSQTFKVSGQYFINHA